ncbi:glycosyltransferase family protein [Bremerella volcania]|nr:hypothetical protein [Bremerella volcania]
MRPWLHQNWGHLAGIAMLVLASIGLIRIAFLNAFAADEIAFFVWGSSMLQDPEFQGIGSPLFRLNEAGYGSSYWTLYVNLIDWFETDAFWILRTLACIAFVSIPVSIAVVGNMAKPKFGYLLAALWLTMPIAWWCGKITGPETFALAMAVYGVLLLYSDSHLRESLSPRMAQVVAPLGWILIGGAVSLKLTMMPTAIFAFLLHFTFPMKEGKSLKTVSLKMFHVTGLMACGFLLMTPIVIFDSAAFVQRIVTLPSGEAWSWMIAKTSLNNHIWGWDGVFSGGLVQWSLCPLAFLILAGMLLIKQRRVFLILLISFLACWLMIASKGALLGWYWFGWIPMIVLSLLWVLKPDQPNRGLIATVASVILINLLFQTPDIVERYSMKSQQAISLTQRSSVQQALSEITNGKSYDLVLDYWEVSHVGGLEFPKSGASELVQMTPPETNFVSDRRSSKDSAPRRFDPGVVKANAFCRIHDMGTYGTEGKSVLVVVSKRLASKHAFADFDRFLTERVIPNSPDQTTYSRIVDLPETAIYEIHSGASVAGLVNHADSSR